MTADVDYHDILSSEEAFEMKHSKKHRYSSYDGWRTENPYDGQARQAGYKDEADMMSRTGVCDEE